MNVGELVGTIATAILREELLGDADEAAQGTSRFLLDFSPDHTAAIAQAVLADSYLDPKIEIKLPASHVGCHGLPIEVLTDYPATYFRNAACPKDAFLLAGGEHSEEASFNEIARLSPAELLDRIDLWIRTVSDGLHLSEDHCRWWGEGSYRSPRSPSGLSSPICDLCPPDARGRPSRRAPCTVCLGRSASCAPFAAR